MDFTRKTAHPYEDNHFAYFAADSDHRYRADMAWHEFASVACPGTGRAGDRRGRANLTSRSARFVSRPDCTLSGSARCPGAGGFHLSARSRSTGAMDGQKSNLERQSTG